MNPYLAVEPLDLPLEITMSYKEFRQKLAAAYAQGCQDTIAKALANKSE